MSVPNLCHLQLKIPLRMKSPLPSFSLFFDVDISVFEPLKALLSPSTIIIITIITLHTFLLTYFHTFILSYFHTFKLSYFHTLALLHCCIFSVSYICLFSFFTFTFLKAMFQSSRNIRAVKNS